MRFRERRIGGERAFERRSGFPRTGLALIGIAECSQPLRPARLERSGAEQLVDCLGRAPFGQAERSEVVARLAESGIELEGRPVGPRRSIKLALALQNRAEVAVRLGVSGIDFERLAAAALRGLKLLRFEMRNAEEMPVARIATRERNGPFEQADGRSRICTVEAALRLRREIGGLRLRRFGGMRQGLSDRSVLWNSGAMRGASVMRAFGLEAGRL